MRHRHWDALLPVLFERFSPARRPGLRGEPTNGLGLLLCKTIVEWHQGTITVASTEGVGTTFTVEIPRPNTKKVIFFQPLVLTIGTGKEQHHQKLN